MDAEKNASAMINLTSRRKNSIEADLTERTYEHVHWIQPV